MKIHKFLFDQNHVTFHLWKKYPLFWQLTPPHNHPGLELELSVEIFSSKSINRLAYSRYVASKWAQFWNDLIRSWREIAKIAINSHMAKSPMLPNGGILTRPSNKSCRASNSGWKSGIVSLIWLNQSKKGPIRNLDLIFGKIVLVWTG